MTDNDIKKLKPDYSRFATDVSLVGVPSKRAKAGNRYRNTYTREIALDGKKSLKLGEPEDLFELVQQNARGVTFRELFARMSAGDPLAIPAPVTDMDIDMTGSPKSLMEAADKLAQARQKFESFPADLRKEYNNDFSAFLDAVGDGSFVKAQQKKAQAAAELKQLKAQSAAAAPAFSQAQLDYLSKTYGGNNK